MSDATGFGTGGSTNVLTVGESLGASCNITDPGIYLSSTFHWYENQFVHTRYRLSLPIESGTTAMQVGPTAASRQESLKNLFLV